MPVYWLGAPGVAQLEYPPGSGIFYGIGDYVHGMSETEATAMAQLGHSFEVPNVYPYGTPYQEPAPTTTRRVAIAQRTGEPEDAGPGMILSGPAPQSAWASETVAESVETAGTPPPVAYGLGEPVTEDVEGVVAVAVPEPEIAAVAGDPAAETIDDVELAEPAPEPVLTPVPPAEDEEPQSP